MRQRNSSVEKEEAVWFERSWDTAERGKTCSCISAAMAGPKERCVEALECWVCGLVKEDGNIALIAAAMQEQ